MVSKVLTKEDAESRKLQLSKISLGSKIPMRHAYHDDPDMNECMKSVQHLECIYEFAIAVRTHHTRLQDSLLANSKVRSESSG